jgi:hypothetical protein
LLPVALLAAVACQRATSFDPDAWKADAMTERHQVLDVRRAMVADVRRQFRLGTPKSVVLRNFGPAEFDARRHCDIPGADNCLGYDLGASMADYDFLIFAFKGERLESINDHRS